MNRRNTAHIQPIDDIDDQYWQFYADMLLSQFESNSKLAQITKNSALIGAYTEEMVKQITKKICRPYDVYTGSICGPKLFSKNQGDSDEKGVLKQIDLIISTPSPMPPLFVSDEFAIVSDQSVLGALEIKSSLYNNDVGSKMEETLNWIDEVSRGVWDSAKPVKDVMCGQDSYPLGLGVICVLKQGQKIDSVTQELIDKKRCVVLLAENNDGTHSADKRALINLIVFLARARHRVNEALAQNISSSAYMLNRSPDSTSNQ